MKLPEKIIEVNQNQKKENEFWNQVYGGMSVEVEVGELLYALIRSTKPRIVVETGTGDFYSTAHILQAIADNGFGFLHTFDIKQKFNEHDYPEFNDKYIFYLGDALEMGKKLIRNLDVEPYQHLFPSTIDFIFLDSDHTYEQVTDEFNLFYPYLKVGGVICFHDTILDKREQKAVDEIRLRNDIEMIRLFTSRGLDVGVKLS